MCCARRVYLFLRRYVLPGPKITILQSIVVSLLYETPARVPRLNVVPTTLARRRGVKNKTGRTPVGIRKEKTADIFLVFFFSTARRND